MKSYIFKDEVVLVTGKLEFDWCPVHLRHLRIKYTTVGRSLKSLSIGMQLSLRFQAEIVCLYPHLKRILPNQNFFTGIVA